MVGARGFEPPTLCSQSRCASQAALRPDTASLTSPIYVLVSRFCIFGPAFAFPKAMKNSISFRGFSGFTNLLVLATGGYFAWRNRFKIQQFMEANGIPTPWMRENASEAVRSGVAKIKGRVEHGQNVAQDHDVSRAV
jgi:hypothetical protein